MQKYHEFYYLLTNKALKNVANKHEFWKLIGKPLLNLTDLRIFYNSFSFNVPFVYDLVKYQ